MKIILSILLVLSFVSLCNAQSYTVMVDTNRSIISPSNGFSSITLGGVTISSWIGPTSGLDRATCDSLYVTKLGTNGAMTGILTNTAGFKGDLSGSVIGNVSGSVAGNVTGDLTGNVIGNVTNSSTLYLQSSHGIVIDTNGIWMR